MLAGSGGYAQLVLCFFFIFILFLIVTAVLTIVYEADAESKEELRQKKPLSLAMSLYRKTGNAASAVGSVAATPCTWMQENCIRCVPPACLCRTGDSESGAQSSGNPELDTIFDMAFELHDVNDSKTIDTVAEMTALVNTLCIKLQIATSPQQVGELILSMGNLSDETDGSLNWTKPKTKDWFLNHFLDVWVNEAEANQLYQQEEEPTQGLGLGVVPGVTPQDLPTFLAELEEAGGDTSQDAALAAEAVANAQ